MQMSSSCQIKSVKHLKNVYLLQIIPAENVACCKDINMKIYNYCNQIIFKSFSYNGKTEDKKSNFLKYFMAHEH